MIIGYYQWTRTIIAGNWCTDIYIDITALARGIVYRNIGRAGNGWFLIVFYFYRKAARSTVARCILNLPDYC